VTIGVIVSATVESKQKNLLISPARLGYKNFKLNIITIQLGPNTDLAYKGSQVL